MVSVLLIAWRADWFPAPFALGRYTLAVLAANGVGELGLVAEVFFLRRYLCAAESEDLVFASLTLLFGTAGVGSGYRTCGLPTGGSGLARGCWRMES